ncbi:hypothetical protein [Streptomyces flaveolus]|uniref:hypothetical protein n=1 Tax=Streptomyces flaveolus TaxID=67297 RepID=UPI00332AA6DA
MGWLTAAMVLTIELLMPVGLPKEYPQQEATGTVPSGGGKVTSEIEEDDTQTPSGTSGRKSASKKP